MAFVFNQKKYNEDEILEAFLSVSNRKETMRKHKCTEEDLKRNPDWLLQNFVDSGRAARFSAQKLRVIMGGKKDDKEPA